MRTELQSPPQAGFAAPGDPPGSPIPADAPALLEADRVCARLTRRHYENFPVASLLVPRALRPSLRAIYAFARTADDIADEPAAPGERLDQAERLRRLDAWERMLRRAFEGDVEHPVFVALAAARSRHGLPLQPFLDLLAAFRLDVVKSRHPDQASLLDYCRLSANPVGRLVLHLFARRDENLLPLSDALCTGLQLANHWQDVAVDAARGRIYLPAEARLRHGVREETLAAGPATAEMRALLREMVGWTRGFFAAARPLPERVKGSLRFELRLTREGGLRVLERIEAAGYDVWRRPPRLTPLDASFVLARALVGRA
ncbi:MAG TPA: squalene synthase HpnC [Candidatus Polarisedimenticolia bacterium]|jgi:squalene synthase HpnC|nr:squalene synthase HpnC [Candidatus Polarisedimenticolia bacterium]